MIVYKKSISNVWYCNVHSVKILCSLRKVMMTSSNGNIFPRYWPFVRGIHRSPVNSPHKGQWRGALVFSLICVRINGWVNNGEAGDLRRYRAHYDVTVMLWFCNVCDYLSLCCHMVSSQLGNTQRVSECINLICCWRTTNIPWSVNWDKTLVTTKLLHDDVIKWKHFPRYRPFVRGICRSLVNSPNKMTRSFDAFFDLRLNKRLSKQSWGWWLETLSRPLWRHRNMALQHALYHRQYETPGLCLCAPEIRSRYNVNWQISPFLITHPT